MIAIALGHPYSANSVANAMTVLRIQVAAAHKTCVTSGRCISISFKKSLARLPLVL